MAITTCTPDSFFVELLDGTGHDFGATPDTFYVALYTDAATLDKDTTVYSVTNEVTGTGYDAGGKQVTVSASQPHIDGANHVVWIDLEDLSWTGSEITAAGCLIYNASKGNRAVGILDFGGNKVSADGGTFTIEWPVPAYNSAIMRFQGSP